jgi:hypothetical protein
LLDGTFAASKLLRDFANAFPSDKSPNYDQPLVWLKQFHQFSQHYAALDAIRCAAEFQIVYPRAPSQLLPVSREHIGGDSVQPGNKWRALLFELPY